MFMAEYYLIEKFIKDNLVDDRKFFKQVLNLKEVEMNNIGKICKKDHYRLLLNEQM